MRMLTGALESLETAKSVNSAMEIVPVVEAKLEQPGIDGPQILDRPDKVPLKRRFFEQLFRSIKGRGAVQLLVYTFDPDTSKPKVMKDRNALGARFLEFPGIGTGTLDPYLSSNISQLAMDSPHTLYRIILSASPVNDDSMIVVDSVNPATVEDFSRGYEPAFRDYDIRTGSTASTGSDGQTIEIAELKSSVQVDQVSSLAVRVHLFPQPYPFAPGMAATQVGLNKSIRAKDLAFTFDTLLLAY